MYPPKPSFQPLVSTADRQRVFGKFQYQAKPLRDNPENIVILGGWQVENIVRVVVPQLVGVPYAPNDGGIYFHRRATAQLLSLFAAWEKAGLLNRILTWGGSFVPRFIRGSHTTLSNHRLDGMHFEVAVVQ